MALSHNGREPSVCQSPPKIDPATEIPVARAGELPPGNAHSVSAALAIDRRAAYTQRNQLRHFEMRLECRVSGMLDIDDSEVLRDRAATFRLQRPDTKRGRVASLDAFVRWQKNCRDAGNTGCKALHMRAAYSSRLQGLRAPGVPEPGAGPVMLARRERAADPHVANVCTSVDLGSPLRADGVRRPRERSGLRFARNSAGIRLQSPWVLPKSTPQPSRSEAIWHSGCDPASSGLGAS